MVLSEYERKLQSVNPDLYIKRYGNSMAAIHTRKRGARGDGDHFVCRIPQGEILEHNVTEVREGYADQYKSEFNPTGRYKFKLMTRRGRREAAQILYTSGQITFDDISKLI